MDIAQPVLLDAVFVDISVIIPLFVLHHDFVHIKRWWDVGDVVLARASDKLLPWTGPK